ncbi:hypothetical protein OF117_13455 [Geodermatophilus sp. YIM 151500]|uniref:hypothetical protein n=1 Tax=Geodermatophilus sp. YIM 151500 TaxID=2984531 RepID=UPI0021E4734D|nr:hypothetical protein [Geodermatophilus sp. YIM 151500]MCV2490369.1 hypothetical protein [Geodermatophilus sp. YIM 151500]
MARTADQTGQAPPAARGRGLGPVRAGLLAAVVFVAGLVAGGLAVGLLSAGPVVVEAGPGGAGEGGVPGGALPPEGASAQFVVNGPCLGAVNAAQDTFLVLDDLGRAAADLDAAALDEVVRRLIPLQDRLETGLDACRVSTEVGPGAAPPSDVAPGRPLPTDTPATDTPATGTDDDTGGTDATTPSRSATGSPTG